MTRLTDAEFNAQPHIDHCDCTREHADDRCVAYRVILAAEGKVLDYDGTERTVEWMHEHLRTVHNYNPEVLGVETVTVTAADRPPVSERLTAAYHAIFDVKDHKYHYDVKDHNYKYHEEAIRVAAYNACNNLAELMRLLDIPAPVREIRVHDEGGEQSRNGPLEVSVADGLTVLAVSELAGAHAKAHHDESGIGDREPTVDEVTTIVMKLVDETINDPDYVNSRGENMPWNVTDFSTLHEYTDANMYLIEAEAHFGATGWDFADGDDTGFQKAVGHANEVTDAVTLILTDRVDNVKPIMEWNTSECYARILNPDWLTERPFILNWTDHVTQEESFRFETLSEAVVCLGALIHCGEDAWRSGFNLGNEEFDDAIADFFGKAIS